MDLTILENAGIPMEQSIVQHSSQSINQEDVNKTMNEQVLTGGSDAFEVQKENASKSDPNFDDHEHIVKFENDLTSPHLIEPNQLKCNETLNNLPLSQYENEKDLGINGDLRLKIDEDIKDKLSSEEIVICFEELKKKITAKPDTSDNSNDFIMDQGDTSFAEQKENMSQSDGNIFKSDNKCMVTSLIGEKKIYNNWDQCQIIEDLSCSLEPAQEQEKFGSNELNHNKINTLHLYTKDVDCILPEKFEMEFEDSTIVEDATNCCDTEKHSLPDEKHGMVLIDEDRFACTDGDSEETTFTDINGFTEQMNLPLDETISAIDHNHQLSFNTKEEILTYDQAKECYNIGRAILSVEDNMIGSNLKITENSLNLEFSSEQDHINCRQNHDGNITNQEVKIDDLNVESSTEQDEILDTNSQQNRDDRVVNQDFSIETFAAKNVNLNVFDNLELPSEQDTQSQQNLDGEVINQEMDTDYICSVETSAVKTAHRNITETNLNMKETKEECDTLDKKSQQSYDEEITNKEMKVDYLPSSETSEFAKIDILTTSNKKQTTEQGDTTDKTSQQNHDEEITNQEMKTDTLPSTVTSTITHLNVTETSADLESTVEQGDTIDKKSQQIHDGEVTNQEMKIDYLLSAETSAITEKDISKPSLNLELSTKPCDAIDKFNHNNSQQICNGDLKQEMKLDIYPFIKVVDDGSKTSNDTSVEKYVHFASPVYTFHEYNESVCSSRTETQESEVITSQDKKEMNESSVEILIGKNQLSEDANKSDTNLRFKEDVIEDVCKSDVKDLQEHEDAARENAHMIENTDLTGETIMEEVKDILDKLIISCMNINEQSEPDNKLNSFDQLENSFESSKIHETKPVKSMNSPKAEFKIIAAPKKLSIIQNCISQDSIDNSLEDYTDKAKKLKEENIDKLHQIMSPQCDKIDTENNNFEILTFVSSHSDSGESDHEDQPDQCNEEFVFFDSDEEHEETEVKIKDSSQTLEKDSTFVENNTENKQTNGSFHENSDTFILEKDNTCNMKVKDTENQTFLPYQEISDLDKNGTDVVIDATSIAVSRKRCHSLALSSESQNLETIQEDSDMPADDLKIKKQDLILNIKSIADESLNKTAKDLITENPDKSCSTQFVPPHFVKQPKNLAAARNDLKLPVTESFHESMANEESFVNFHLLSSDKQQSCQVKETAERKRKIVETSDENEEPLTKMPYHRNAHSYFANTTEISHVKNKDVIVEAQTSKTLSIKDLPKNSNDGIYEENLHHIEDMDQTVPSGDNLSDVHLQDENIASRTIDTLYTSETDKEGKNSLQAFKWKYAPSIDLEAIVPGSEEQVNDDKPLIPAPLQTCKKPCRLGLSKRQKLPSLHPKMRPT